MTTWASGIILAKKEVVAARGEKGSGHKPTGEAP